MATVSSVRPRHQHRLARLPDRSSPPGRSVASLEASLVDPDLNDAERLERILAAWRSELDYGREMDAWRGYLNDDQARREVEALLRREHRNLEQRAEAMLLSAPRLGRPERLSRQASAEADSACP